MTIFKAKVSTTTSGWDVVHTETGVVKCTCNGRNARGDATEIAALLSKSVANNLQIALMEDALK